MKLNKFTLGIVAGIASIGVAIPLIAQMSSAASSVNGSPDTTSQQFARPAPTQTQVREMIARDDAFLENVDAFVAAQKTAIAAHRTALTAAASITDDTQRHQAVKKANEDLRNAMQAALKANPDLQSAMMPFGGRGPGDGRGGPGMMGRGPNTATLATKLGMTEADLQAALDSGKTIEQIATEKGITLPAGRGDKRGRGWMMGRGPAEEDNTSSAQ